MLRKIFALLVLLNTFLFAPAQILGGGTLFSNAVVFNPSWISGCPAGGTSFSNQAVFEPTTAIDPCAPAPTCVIPGGSNASGSDVWFSFFAQSATATIAVNPSASFNAAIQAFSGSACPGLTQIGCSDIGGINQVETLVLTSLSINQLYYFRVFGFGNPAARTGTYTFCGSAGLGSTVLAVSLINFNATRQNNTAVLNWTTESENNNAYFEIERSENGTSYSPVVKVAGAGTTSFNTPYIFTDITPLTSAVTYYRLKEVSTDGSFKYSFAVTIRRDNNLKNAVTVLNNPVAGNLNISVNATAPGIMQLKIINNSGQVVYQQKNNLVRGHNIFNITAAGFLNYAKGIYNLQVTINNEKLNKKFIIAR
ncbi:T9SS type A sorting domain-containing protein [Ferruginibacter sp.]